MLEGLRGIGRRKKNWTAKVGYVHTFTTQEVRLCRNSCQSQKRLLLGEESVCFDFFGLKTQVLDHNDYPYNY